jgi:hypothetical protein
MMSESGGLQKQIEIYRSMTGLQRLQVSLELYDLARALVRSGVLHDHPDWSEREVCEEVNRRFGLAAGIRSPKISRSKNHDKGRDYD